MDANPFARLVEPHGLMNEVEEISETDAGPPAFLQPSERLPANEAPSKEKGCAGRKNEEDG